MNALKLAVSATIIATTSASFLRTDVQNEGCPLNTAKESCCGTTQCGTNNCFFFVDCTIEENIKYFLINFILPPPPVVQPNCPISFSLDCGRLFASAQRLSRSQGCQRRGHQPVWRSHGGRRCDSTGCGFCSTHGRRWLYGSRPYRCRVRRHSGQ